MMVKDAFDRWWEWAEKPAGSTQAQSISCRLASARLRVIIADLEDQLRELK
jgi:hypothetical protein